MNIDKKIEEALNNFLEIESFDSFFAGLPAKDEKKSGELYNQKVLKPFFKKALTSTRNEALEEAKEAIEKYLEDPNWNPSQIRILLKEINKLIKE